MRKKDTDIEILMESEFIRRNIKYEKQKIILKAHTVVDFLLPNNVVIYCDGDYWHSREKNKGKDISQDTVLYFNGYKVFRFSGTEIRKSANKCIDKIIMKKIK